MVGKSFGLLSPFEAKNVIFKAFKAFKAFLMAESHGWCGFQRLKG